MTLYGALVAVLTLLLLAPGVAAAGEKIAVFGADLSAGGRQELEELFEVDPATRVETVTTQELVATLQGTGLPVAQTDRSISSAALTCFDRGQGLNVRTQNITRIPAAVYANALVTAGVGDGDVLVAAPSTNPVTGETALVGIFKAFPQCQGAPQPDPARLRLAYEQVARTVALAGPTGDLETAAETMLRAAQPVITGQAQDDATVGAALDEAAAVQGLTIAPAQRAETIAFLKRLGGADYGTYAQGYQIEESGPEAVRVVPVGAGVPGATAGTTFSGDVTRGGAPLTVRVNGQERPVSPAPNVVVIRDGRNATVNDIQPNDRVNVTVSPDGQATRIEASSAGAQAPVAPAAGTTFSGEVTRGGAPLGVRVDGQDRQVNPAPNVTVIRDGTPAAVADLRPTDRVNVTTGPDGLATRIEASSTAAGAPAPAAPAAQAPAATATVLPAAPPAEAREEGGFPWWWLLPLLLLPLLLRRRRAPFIIEREAMTTTRTTTVAEPATTKVTTAEPLTKVTRTVEPEPAPRVTRTVEAEPTTRVTTDAEPSAKRTTFTSDDTSDANGRRRDD
jgi:uncharacterized protein YpuA (DUF1002 family)